MRGRMLRARKRKVSLSHLFGVEGRDGERNTGVRERGTKPKEMGYTLIIGTERRQEGEKEGKMGFSL